MSIFASSSILSPSTAPTSLSSSDQNQPSSNTFKFTNPQDLFKLVDTTSGDSLIITDVSPRDFADLDEQRETRGFRWRRYYAESEILINIAIPTHAHEKLHSMLYELFRDQVPTRISTWCTKAATTFRASRDRGEGDSTGGPIPERFARDKWPTLVIEAGVSESLAQLRLDMQWWFTASNHDVKIVLLAKLDNNQQMITLEKWVEEPVAATPGAMTTRQAAALRPILQQTITIHRNEATRPISYNVTRGALLLEFRLLFLRSPGSREGDIIIGVSDLQWYAECVWA